MSPPNPTTGPTPEHRYAEVGLRPLPNTADPAALYIDLVKRAVANVLYEDPAIWYFDEHNERRMAGGFDLQLRMEGRDLPAEAHTMVGMRRLDHLQRCVETIVREGVPGDLVEAGVLRGGACILMRAVLKAHHVTDRCVVACDTFQPRKPLPSGLAARAGVRILQLLASVPNREFKRRLFFAVQRGLGEQRSFPVVTNPSEDMVNGTMFMLRHIDVLRNARDRTSLAAVRSHFARYGLLDEQVLFLQGFFSDTLPSAPIAQVALVRLDGDTYESTRDVLEGVYPKLQPGGFCIIDDYHAFPDCRRAVDEYRTAHAITAPLEAIDRHAVFWREPVRG